jgi:hypothetical protein
MQDELARWSPSRNGGVALPTTLGMMMMGQFLSAVVYATVFRLVTNLLTVWPLIWAASSARICIASGFCFFTWGSAMFMLFLLVIETGFIGFMAHRVRTTDTTHTTRASFCVETNRTDICGRKSKSFLLRTEHLVRIWSCGGEVES